MNPEELKAAEEAAKQELEKADADFETSIADLPEEEQTTKRTEYQDKRKAEDISYRGKLNAQNRSLEKQGFKFNLETKQWEKPEAKPKPADTQVQQSALSPIDIIALTKADLPAEDIAQVQEYATFKKISVADALKDSVMSGILAQNAEVRRSAAAAQAGGGQRSATAPSGEDLLTEQEKGTGKVLETDEEMQKLWRARQARKVRKH